jgi:hypothetical protein
MNQLVQQWQYSLHWLGVLATEGIIHVYGGHSQQHHGPKHMP